MGKVLKHRVPSALDTLVKLYRALKQKQAALEEQMGACRANLLEAAIRAGGKAETATDTVTVVAPEERKTLDRQKLQNAMLAAGLTPKKIEGILTQATTVTAVKPYARVDAKKAS